MTTAEQLIEHLNLQPHPEGGYFSEPYRSKEMIPKSGLPARFPGDRCLLTLAYFLLPSGTTKLRRIKSDEVIHFYTGNPLRMTLIFPDRVEKVTLGHDRTAGQRFHQVIPAGCWCGFSVETEGYSLFGCTVAPGFEFEDFELGDPEKLLREFPHAREEILQLT